MLYLTIYTCYLVAQPYLSYLIPVPMYTSMLLQIYYFMRESLEICYLLQCQPRYLGRYLVQVLPCHVRCCVERLARLVANELVDLVKSIVQTISRQIANKVKT